LVHLYLPGVSLINKDYLTLLAEDLSQIAEGCVELIIKLKVWKPIS
jgi:hypothetical protein